MFSFFKKFFKASPKEDTLKNLDDMMGELYSLHPLPPFDQPLALEHAEGEWPHPLLAGSPNPSQVSLIPNVPYPGFGTIRVVYAVPSSKDPLQDADKWTLVPGDESRPCLYHPKIKYGADKDMSWSPTGSEDSGSPRWGEGVGEFGVLPFKDLTGVAHVMPPLKTAYQVPTVVDPELHVGPVAVEIGRTPVGVAVAHKCKDVRHRVKRKLRASVRKVFCTKAAEEH